MTKLPANPPERPKAQAIETVIKSEQVKQLYDALGKSLLTTAIVSLLLVVALWPSVNQYYLTGWAITILIVSVVRFFNLRRYKQDINSNQKTIAYERQFLAGCIFAAICWGTSALLLFPATDMSRQVFLAFVLGGMSAGAITSLSYQKLPIFIFQIAVLAPLATRFLLGNNELGTIMSLMIFLYLAMLLLASHNSYKSFRQNILLRFEQHEQKDLVRENEQKYRTLFELSNDAIMTLDTEGFIDCNPATLKMFGCSSKEEFLGKHPGEISPPLQADGTDSHSAANERIATAYREGKNLFEWTHRRVNGEDFTAEVLLTPMMIDGRNLLKAIVRDIDDRKKSELNLVNALEQARKANKAKSDFLSSMSHELRTPLNAILGFAQILELDANDESEIQNINEIIRAGKHLLSLINDILDLSKIEAGKIEVTIRDTRLNDILQECLTLVEPQASKKRITIQDGITDHTDYYIQADEIRFKQVVLNLLSNAIKYNIENGLVKLRCEVVDNETQLELGFMDTGFGINEDQKKTLFEPFERGQSHDAIEGTGIGLVITRKLIELMEGSIYVQSMAGEGSEFVVRIPLCQSEKPAKQETGHSEQARKKSSRPANEKLIVYIEDNSANTNLVKQVVEELTPYRFMSAEEAFTGLKLIEAERPDLVLMDINLPGMDGYEARKKLSQNNDTSDIPVIAVSANAMASDIEKARSLGFTDYLTKPVDIRVLRETLDKILV